MRLEHQVIGIKIVLVTFLCICMAFRRPQGLMLLLWVAMIAAVILSALLSVLLVRRMCVAIDKIISRSNEISAGDLTGAPIRFQHPDNLRQLGNAVNAMQMRLAEMISTIAGTSSTLSGNAGSMRTSTEGVHRRIDLQTQQTHQAAAAMAEMSASIAEVSRHTQSAAETAREAAQTAHAGGLIVKGVLASMNGISATVHDTSTLIGLLGEDSQRISQIIITIDEVAKKTNLLALNAAIEAARAGEQGRGFAVVAGEVRRLAENTGRATGEISHMIEGIQQRIRSAVVAMQTGTGIVGEGVTTTTQAGEALERIIGMAERVDRMITQIAVAASQQSSTANLSAASLEQIHTLSNENLAEVSTTTIGLENLRDTAHVLECAVDRYIVPLPARRRGEVHNPIVT